MVVVAVVDAAVAPLTAFYLLIKADRLAWGEPLGSFIARQGDAVLLDAGYLHTSEADEGKCAQDSLDVALFPLPVAGATHAPRLMTVLGMQHDGSRGGSRLLEDAVLPLAILADVRLLVGVDAPSVATTGMELAFVAFTLMAEITARQHALALRAVIGHFAFVYPLAVVVFDVSVFPYQGLGLSLSERVRQFNTLGSPFIALPRVCLFQFAILPLLSAVHAFLSVMEGQVAVVGHELAYRTAIVVDAVTVRQTDGYLC